MRNDHREIGPKQKPRLRTKNKAEEAYLKLYTKIGDNFVDIVGLRGENFD